MLRTFSSRLRTSPSPSLAAHPRSLRAFSQTTRRNFVYDLKRQAEVKEPLAPTQSEDLLGVEMASTGEVAAFGKDLAEAYWGASLSSSPPSSFFHPRS
ncbi:hypothetical protein JCM10207_000704 [Rhodosporidiobolus poonsookiae]